MELDRRTFLRLASASPLVFGLRDALGLVAVQEIPAWWKTALDRMAKLDRPGLVVVMPESEDAREAYARAILNLLESEDSRAREVFCGAVVIFLRRAPARACLGDDAAEGRVLALSPAGRVIDKADRVLNDLKDVEAFLERASKLLYGDADVRLVAVADKMREGLTAEEKGALADLVSDEPAKRDAAIALLARNSESLMPFLIHERRRSKEPERAARIRSIIDARFNAADEKSPGPRLPFGARIEPGHSCAAEEEGVPIQCGRARLEGKGQRLLQWLD